MTASIFFRSLPMNFVEYTFRPLKRVKIVCGVARIFSHGRAQCKYESAPPLFLLFDGPHTLYRNETHHVTPCNNKDKWNLDLRCHHLLPFSLQLEPGPVISVGPTFLLPHLDLRLPQRGRRSHPILLNPLVEPAH